MKNPQGSTTGWVVGISIVVLVILGIWWFMSMTPATDTSGNATTTGEVATTSDNGGGNTATASETRSSSTVAAVVSSLSTGSSFNSLFTSTGVAASLTGSGPYTVFVPMNSAFGSVSTANMTAAEKKRLAQYHVVSGKALDIDAVSSGTYTALSKDELNFRVDLTYKEAFVNSGYAITQYKASNGIVYVISQTLIPPQTAGTTTGSTGTPHP